MEWIDITRWIVIAAEIALGAWYLIWSRNKSTNYMDQRLLTIQMWIIAIFIMITMKKITIVIAL